MAKVKLRYIDDTKTRNVRINWVTGLGDFQKKSEGAVEKSLGAVDFMRD